MSVSWYVETLLRNRYKIRENIITKENTLQDTIISTNLDDDDYNNLLLVEKTLKELLDNKQLSYKEIIIVNKVLEYKSLSEIERETGYTRITVAKFFEQVCDRISFILGDGFTNEGYLTKLAKKYKLNQEQLAKAEAYMNSNKRYYILKKTKE